MSSRGAEADRNRRRKSDRAEWAEWAEQAVSHYVQWLTTLPIKIRLVILFGSYAKGTFDEESDIDILVVADGLPPVNDAVSLLTIGTPDELAGACFEPHPYSPQAFILSLNNDGRAAAALIEGQVLYIDHDYRKRLLKAISRT